MPLVKVSPGSTELIKFCPAHPAVALIQEEVFLAGGNRATNFYRCPQDNKVYDDKPISQIGTSNA